MDTAASVSCLGKEAAADRALIQLKNKQLDTPSAVPVSTTETMRLRMNKLPERARTAFTVEELPHNLLTFRARASGCGMQHMTQ